MNALRLALVAVLVSLASAAAASEGRPWSSPDAALVIDAYEQNPIRWDELATEPRVVAIIHRATIGSRIDARYRQRRDEARRRGYAWGSYHVAGPGDPVKQADRYLEVADPGPDDVLVLDIERLGGRTGMTLANARRFLQHVHRVTGRWPMVYGNDAVIRRITGLVGRDAVFARTSLWYARFREHVPDFPAGTWASCALWQFSSEINCSDESCPVRIAGTERDMDVSVFAGTRDALREAWPFDGAAPTNP